MRLRLLFLCSFLSIHLLSGYHPSCYPCHTIYCCRGSVNADILYWRAFEEGFDSLFPTSFTSTEVNDISFTTATNRGRDPHFKWNLGVRGGYEYEVADNWEMSSSVTHFYSRAHHFEDNGNFLRIKISFTTADLIARYKLASNDCFFVKPHFGIRCAQINQRLHSLQLPDLTSPDTFVSIEQKNREKLGAVGPLAGFEASGYLKEGFSCYFCASVGCLYGEYKIKQSEVDTNTASLVATDDNTHIKASQVFLDGEIGLRYQRPFLLSTQISVQIGLEHHHYFNYNKLADKGGDLSFDGMNFSLGLLF